VIKLFAETPRDQKIIDSLSKALKKKDEKIEKLEKELEEYRKRHPATVGVKNGKSYEIREQSVTVSESPGGEKRKPGAQMGHKGHFRRTPKITERVHVKQDAFTCPECSSKLVRKGIRTRVIEDIPDIIPQTIQYRIQRLYCKKCRRIYEPDMPEALPNARLSIRTMLIAAYLKTGMRMSLESVSTTMKEIFGIRISEGEIQQILYQLSDSLGHEYNNLLETIRKAPSRHMDTTSWRQNGINRALWVFVTRGEAIFHVANSNNHEVAMEMLGEHSGTDIHDRFSAFDTLASKSHNQQQFCWSHIICDAKELESFYGQEGARIKKHLQQIYKEAKSFHGKGSAEDVDDLHHKLVFLLDTDYEHDRSRKFVENLLKRKKEWLFRFVVDPEVEPTNNRAERALRPAVIYRKTLGGSRSDRGSEAYERLHSIFYTEKIRKESIIKHVPEMIKRKVPHPG